MRRLVYFLILVVVVGTSARCVNASTDCERWFTAYRTQLLHTQQMQRIAAAKRRAKLYAQRKLDGYVAPKPKPKPKLVRTHTPRMSRQDALHHFDLACGVLPETSADLPLLSEETIPEGPGEDEIGLLSGFDGPGTLLPEDTPPPPTFAQSPPVESGPPVFQPPYTGGGGGGGGTPPPVTPVVPVTPPPVVPEPSSIVFLLTGCAGAAGVLRRRWKA
jgi:hypothetical protein